MKVLLVKPKGVDLTKYKKILDKRKVEYVEITQTFPKEILNDTSLIEMYCETLYTEFAETIDYVQFFIEEKDWVESMMLRGRMYNKLFSGYLVSFTRMRFGYENTAEHELMHKLDNTVYIYLGLNINAIMGISDWDTVVVHGDVDGDKFVNYSYDYAWELIRPYLDKAIERRRKLALLSYYQQLLIWLRIVLLQLQVRAMEVKGLQHPLKGATVSYKYGVPDTRYKLTAHHIGTDYALQIDTDILAPKDGDVIVAGYSTSLGNFCHYKYTHDGKVFVARFLHLNNIPKRGSYKRGEVFAQSGDTGDSDGPHCHIDIWHDEVRLDLINKTNWKKLTVDPETHFM